MSKKVSILLFKPQMIQTSLSKFSFNFQPPVRDVGLLCPSSFLFLHLYQSCVTVRLWALFEEHLLDDTCFGCTDGMLPRKRTPSVVVWTTKCTKWEKWWNLTSIFMAIMTIKGSPFWTESPALTSTYKQSKGKLHMQRRAHKHSIQ